MKPVRQIIRMGKGSQVKLLVTPRLFEYKGKYGLSFDADPTKVLSVMEVYADIMFAAALNDWELEGNSVEDFTLTRADFHAWMVEDPTEFAKAVNFCVEALTGKDVKELVEGGHPEDTPGKKKVSPLTGWLSRLFS